jgi:UDP-glucose 4-epimerase
VNGADYETPDGTCVRDYVHVADIAAAHVAAASRLAGNEPTERVYNLGSATGTSVAQIMEAISEASGIAFTPAIGDRRPGDPARIVATGALAQRDLDWQNRFTLQETILSAWVAQGVVG